MTEKFESVFLKESGRFWCGKIRTGVTGMTAVCRKLDAPGNVIFKDRPKITAGAVDGFFVKRYNLPGFFTRLRRRFKTPRPLVVLRGAEKLAALGIRTPEVYAALVEKKWFFRREYLVTQLLDKNCRMLDDLPENECYKVVTGKFIPMLKVMHDAGMSHGDLNLRNCFVWQDGEAGLVDLDGSAVGRHQLDMKVRAVELARIISSFLLHFRKLDEAERFTAKVLKIYGGKVSAAATLKAVEKFFQRGKKYLSLS